MLKPATPANEVARLQKLRQYRVLDTLPEPGFDALTALAAHIVGVPIALVSLVDTDRQWFKSRYGLDAPETPRDVSLCGHVVASEVPLVVSDAHLDGRFADNPLVTGEPRLRFYAGVPLRTPDGFVLGTLCAIDREARQLSPHQEELLALLARQVVDQLELRRHALLLEANQERLQSELRKTHDVASRLQSILASSNLSIIETTPTGMIREFNAAAERMLGYPADEIVGKTSPAMFHVLDEVVTRAAELTKELGVTIEPGFEAFIAKARLGSADERDWTYVRKDGTHFPVHLSITARRALSGEVTGYIGIAGDISDRKRIERLQSEFISTVSHELRTPLTSIRGALGLVAGGVTGDLPKEAQEYIEIALSNSDRLVRLINDILDIEKMQSGSMEFRMRATELGEAIRSAIAANEAFASTHRVRLQLSSAIPPGEVLVDPDRLAQVLTNLISNAAKFSPADGVVELSVEQAAGFMRVNIRDHGPGIPDEFRGRIFQRFAQADASSTRQKGGTGLGLSISKAIVEKMRGHIGFEAAPGGGTVFFFELPWLHAVDQADAATQSTARVLVCEDDPDVSRVLEKLLTTAGYAVHLAPTLERARRLLAMHRYDVITLDVVLADGDGTTLIGEVRAAEATRLTPIVVLSGSAGSLGQAALMVSDVILKPFAESRLLTAVQNAVSSCRSDSPRLLHVEDDEDIRRIVKRTLPPSWVVTSAGSVQAAKKALSEIAFDVVLLDLSLPDGTGHELIGLVGLAQVIIFSATDASADLSRQVAAALVKSRANPVDVRDTIIALIARARTQRRPS
ncbi:MAG: response regulator [Myxococcales bacterium]|nr:response regulator [Myxococcales bacterium]